MKFLLDTATCIFFMKGNLTVIENALQVPRKHIFLSSISLYELYTGVGKSSGQRKTAEQQRIKKLVELFPMLIGFERDEAKITGEIRAQIEREGGKIGPYDTLIAGQALCHDLTLVSNNVAEFSRVKSLKLTNWCQRDGTEEPDHTE